MNNLFLILSALNLAPAGAGAFSPRQAAVAARLWVTSPKKMSSPRQGRKLVRTGENGMSKDTRDDYNQYSLYNRFFSSAFQIFIFRAVLLLIIVLLAVLSFWLFGPG